MWVERLSTPRGQAGIALAGVLIIVCAATYTAFFSAQEHERDRAALALVERQGVLVSKLSKAEAGQPRRELVAAADANLAALAALVADDLAAHHELRALLSEARGAWAMYRANVTAGARASLVRASGSNLDQALVSFRGALALQLGEEKQRDAIRQLLILAGAAPLLGWAVFAIAQHPAPVSTHQAEAAEAASRRAAAAALFGAEGRPAVTTRRLTAARGGGEGGLSLRGGHAADEHGRSSFTGELRLYVRDFRQLSGMTVELSLDERAAECVPASAQAQVLNIAREALSNALRYGKASRVSVALWAEPGSVWLSVTDDGAPLAPQGSPCDRQISLAILRARAERIGGALEAGTLESAETVLIARLPALARGEALESHGAPAVGSPRQAW